MRQLINLLIVVIFLACSEKPVTDAPELEYEIKLITTHRIGDAVALDTGFAWTQARAAFVPGATPFAIMTMSQKYSGGSDVYFDLYESYSYDSGNTWSTPEAIPSLRIHDLPDGYRRAMSDMTPQWHKATGKVLNIGKSFFYTDNEKPDRSRQEVAYTVFDPNTKSWSDYKVLKLPELDHDSLAMTAPVSGCSQWIELDNGDVLVPISYRKMTPEQQAQTKREAYDVENNMKSDDISGSVTILRCTFDGETLQYIEHGDELSLKKGRGLGEPSLIAYKGEYFLTLRHDASAYVTKSTDGLHFAPIKEWIFDDGQWLGSYNTQQHWVAHHHGLYLTYTRKGANNDNVFRHRAPLFMAKVDPDSLHVLRATERVLVPNGGIGLGNFGVTDIDDAQTWVTTTEYYRGEKDSVDNEVFLAKILWK